MPSGRVRWFDANKGYGFIQNEQGADVFLPAAALPEGVKTLRKGASRVFRGGGPPWSAGNGPYPCGIRAVSGQSNSTEAG